jgi:hypothetical protein
MVVRQQVSSHFPYLLKHLERSQLQVEQGLGQQQIPSLDSYIISTKIPNKLSCEPEKRLFKVVVTLCRDIIVLQILFAMKGDCLCLDLSFLDINLVSAENNRNIFTNSDKISMPIRNIFVSNSGSNVKHDDCTLALNANNQLKGTSSHLLTHQTFLAQQYPKC